MKTRTTLCGLLCLLFIVASSSASHAATFGLFDYELINDDEVTITDYPEDATGDVVIPSTIFDGTPVTSIGDGAFADCESLTSITIPDSVTSIGEGAFYGCTNLTSVTIGNSVISIGEQAFWLCGSLTSITAGPNNSKYSSSLDGVLFNKDKTTLVTCPGDLAGSYTIPDSVTSIGEGAFYGCRKLTSITIPDNVTSIGRQAFAECWSLTSVTILDNVTSIGDKAFSGCTKLTSVTIGKGVTSTGNFTFEGCNGLTNITIPDNVTSIGNAAFKGCRSLINVTIGKGVTSIGNAAFGECWSLTSVTIPDNVTSIGDEAFSGCINLTSVTIGKGVTSIGSATFSGCNSLTSITIPGNISSIGDQAFEGCRNLTSVTIGKGVNSIGNAAFAECWSLNSVTIPDNVTSIGDEAFSGCTKLTSVTIGKGVTSIGNATFSGCNSLTSITIPGNITSIGDQAFEGCRNLTSVTVPDSVTSIGKGAFYGCSKLTSVTFLGNAPASFGRDVFFLTADSFTVCYLPGSYGFTSPYWNGYSTFPIYFTIDQASEPASPPASTQVSFVKAASGDDYSGFLASENGRKILGRFEGIVLQEQRGFSARMIFGSNEYVLKGRFNKKGRYSKVITPEKGMEATVNLRLVKTESGNYKLEGTVQRGKKTATVVVVKSGEVGSLAGRYTLLIPSEESAPTKPQGHGYATMQVLSAGTAKLTGLLGDGSKWTAECNVTSDGEMPLFSTLYLDGKGWVGGLVSFRDIEGVSDCDGTVHWRKPGNKKSRFSLVRDLIGSRYKRKGVIAGDPATKPNVIADVGAGDGDFGEAVELVRTAGNKKRLLYKAATGEKVKVLKKKGLTEVYITDPELEPIKVGDGVVFQKQDIAAGTYYTQGKTRRSLVITPVE